MTAIAILKKTRPLIAGAVSDLSIEELTWIPPGHRNNILWNMGHIVVTEQLLHYALCDVQTLTPDRWTAMFRKGTSPEEWVAQPDPAPIIEALTTVPERLETDYANGLLTEFRPYETSSGVRLDTLEEALAFNNFHEGIHFGIIRSLRNRVR